MIPDRSSDFKGTEPDCPECRERAATGQGFWAMQGQCAKCDREFLELVQRVIDRDLANAGRVHGR